MTEEEKEPQLKGQKIVDIRLMSQDALDAQGWYRTTAVLMLENGIRLFASSDEEGNDAGAMFGETPQGDCFGVYPNE